MLLAPAGGSAGPRARLLSDPLLQHARLFSPNRIFPFSVLYGWLLVSHHHRWMMGNLSNLGSVWGRAHCVQADHEELPYHEELPEMENQRSRRNRSDANRRGNPALPETSSPPFPAGFISSVLEDVCRTRPSGRDNEANGSVTLETRLKESSNGRTKPFLLRLQVLGCSPA